MNLFKQIEQWREDLLDLSKRNRLIHCPPGSRSNVEIAAPDVETVWQTVAVGNGTMRFVWKEDLIGEPCEVDDPCAVGAGDDADAVEPIPPAGIDLGEFPAAPSGAPPAAAAPGEAGDGIQLDGWDAVDPSGPASAPSAAIHPAVHTASSDFALRPAAGRSRFAAQGAARRRTARPLEEYLASPLFRRGDLLTALPDSQLAARLTRLSRVARESLGEQGVNVLHLAFGLLKWYESRDSTEPIYSPLLLTPVKIQQQGAQGGWKVSEYEDEVVDNQCLRQKLISEFKLQLPPLPENWAEEPDCRRSYMDLVRETCRAHSPATAHWDVVDAAVLSVFSFQKVAMWHDLNVNRDRIAAHPLCRILAGDAGVDPAQNVDLIPVREFDRMIHPAEWHSILDCDSSQLEAIHAARQGRSFVLDGPPGTGKSQTIANIIAEFLAQKKTVLFVAEKSAALEVVRNRLEQQGLGDFLLDCHSHKANKREVIQELDRCLKLAPTEADKQTAELDRLHQERKRLNAYVEALHRPRGRLSATAFQTLSRLAHLGDAPTIAWSISDVLQREPAWYADARDALRQLGACETLLNELETHPWQRTSIQAWSPATGDGLRLTFQEIAGALGELRHRLEPLMRRGLVPEKLSVARLPDRLARAAATLDGPLFPAPWLNPDTIEPGWTREAVPSRLATLAGGFLAWQSGRRTLAEWREIGRLTERIDAASSGQLAWRSLPGETVRQRLNRCERLRETVAETRDTLQNLVDALRSFRRVVGLGWPSPAADVDEIPLPAVLGAVRLGQFVAEYGALRPGWLDDSRRARLQQAAEELERDHRKLVEGRERLLQRLPAEVLDEPVDPWIGELQGLNAPDLAVAISAQARLAVRLNAAAFEPSAAAVLDDVRRRRSFWTRLFGLPRAVKAAAAGLFHDPARIGTGEVFYQFELLQQFHDRHAVLWRQWDALRRRFEKPESPQTLVSLRADLANLKQQQLAAAAYEARCCEFSSVLLRGQDGEVDWPRLRDVLDAVGRMRRSATALDDDLLARLSSVSGLDRAEMAECAGTAAGHGETLRARLEAVAADLSGLPRLDQQTPADAAQRLDALGLELDRGMAEWRRLADELHDGADVPVDALPTVRETAACLDAQRQVLEGDFARLRDLLPEVDAPLDHDWTATMARAREFAAFLERHEGNVPAGLVEAASQADARAAAAAELDAVRAFAGRLGAAPNTPSAPAGNAVPRFEAAWTKLDSIFPDDIPVSTGITLLEAELGELAGWMERQTAAIPRLQELLQFLQLGSRLKRLALEPFLQAVLSGAMPCRQAEPAFVAKFDRLFLDAVWKEDPALRQFRADEHEASIARFRELDRRCLAGTAARIRAALLSDPDRPRHDPTAKKTPELRVLLHQASLKRRHKPIRQLFAEIPTLLTRLKPCIMMSPLAVSTYFENPETQFDLVIFDEASQVRPHDAVGSIARGRQIVVAGDEKQLPPTSFFEKLLADDDEEEDDGEEGRGEAPAGRSRGTRDSESILATCKGCGFPAYRLCWHYRSRREPLIAFSNQQFYNNELVTFPSVLDSEGENAIRFEYCPDGRWITGQRFNPVELRRTVELIVEHIRTQPKFSLGVITFNQKQQGLLLDEVDKLRGSHPDLAPWLDPDREDAFFVKNLENVQGDERDRIIISVAYGPDARGNIPLRFGPLNMEGGERRLNVAVTRSRHSMVVVSSIRAEQLAIREAQARGAHLLRAFLEYAEHGPKVLARLPQETGRGHDSPFEEAVEQALRARGHEVLRQVGCGTFRIDLAIVHPHQPGRYLLGIECDGATYHRARTARDRDRLREQMLNGLGWTICRIWSTDWIANPARQLERIDAACAEALRRS